MPIYIYIYTYIQAHVKSLLGNCSPFAGSCYNNRMHFPFVQFPAVITSDLSIGFEIPTIPSIPPPPLLYTGFRAPLYRHRRQKLLLYVYIYMYILYTKYQYIGGYNRSILQIEINTKVDIQKCRG